MIKVIVTRPMIRASMSEGRRCVAVGDNGTRLDQALLGIHLMPHRDLQVPSSLAYHFEALRQRLGDDGTIAWDELAKKAGIVWQPQEYRPEGLTAV